MDKKKKRFFSHLLQEEIQYIWRKVTFFLCIRMEHECHSEPLRCELISRNIQRTKMASQGIRNARSIEHRWFHKIIESKRNSDNRREKNMNKNNNALRVAVTRKINRINSMAQQKEKRKLYSLLAVNKQISTYAASRQMPRRTYCAFNATYLSIDRMSRVFNEKNTTWRWHTSHAQTMRYLPFQCRSFPFPTRFVILILAAVFTVLNRIRFVCVFSGDSNERNRKYKKIGDEVVRDITCSNPLCSKYSHRVKNNWVRCRVAASTANISSMPRATIDRRPINKICNKKFVFNSSSISISEWPLTDL